MVKLKTRHLIWLVMGIILFTACARSDAGSVPSSATPVVHPPAVPEAYAVKLGSVGKGKPVNAAWSADGSRLAIASELGITIYAQPDWKAENFIESSLVADLAFQMDGNSLFYADGTSNSSVFQANLFNNEIIQLLEWTQSYYSSHFILAPDGNTIVSYRTQRLYYDEDENLASLEIREKLSGAVRYSFYSEIDKASAINDAVYSPDSKWLAVGGEDNHVRVYDVSSGEILLDGNHDSDVKSIAFSPDGKFLVSVGDDAVVRFWDVEAGRSIFALRGFTQAISFVSYCSNGQELLIGLKDDSYQKWSLDEKKLPLNPLAFDFPFKYSDVNKISPDGELLLTIKEEKVQIWDLTTGQLQTTLPEYTNPIDEMEFSADGKFFAAVDYAANVVVWQADTGKYFATLDPEANYVSDVSFHPTKHLLAVARSDKQIVVWDLDLNEIIARYQAAEDCSLDDIQYSPDGSLLAALTSACGMDIWDTTTGKLRTQLKSKSEDFSGTALWFNHAGDEIFAIDYDHQLSRWNILTGELLREVMFSDNTYNQFIDSTHDRVYRHFSFEKSSTLAAWDAVSGEHLFDVGLPDGSSVVAIDPAGTLMAVRQSDSVWFYHLGSMQSLTSLDANINPDDMVFSPDKRFVAAWSHSNEAISIYNIATIYERAALIQNTTLSTPAPTPTSTPTAMPTSIPAGMVDLIPAVVPSMVPGTITKDNIQNIADLTTFGFGLLENAVWSPDSQYFALVGNNITLYRADTGQPVQILNPDNYPEVVVFSPNAQYLAVRTYNNLTLWEVQSGRLLQEWIDYHYAGVSFSPDSQYLHLRVTDYSQGMYTLSDIGLDILSGEVVDTKKVADENDSLHLSPDGDYGIRTSGQAIYIIDPITRTIRYTFERPANTFGTVLDWAISPTGTLMIRHHRRDVADELTTIEMWKVSIDAPPALLWAAETGPFYAGEGSNNYKYPRHAFSPDGMLLAASDENNMVWIWDAASGKLLIKLESGNGVFFSPDAISLLVINRIGSASVWNIWEDRSFSIRADIEGFGNWNTYSSLIKGDSLVSFSNQKVIIWNTVQIKEINLPFATYDLGKEVQGIVTASMGNILASTQKGNINIWNTTNGELLRTLSQEKDPQRGSINTFALSHDEQSLTLANCAEYFQLWDVSTGSLKKEIISPFSLYRFHFSTDDHYLVGTTRSGLPPNGNQLGVWNVETGEMLRHYTIESEMIDLHPDGTKVVAVQKKDTFSLVDLNTGNTVWQEQAGSSIYDLAFSPDGQILILLTYDTLDYWDAISHEKIGSYPVVSDARDILFSLDGKYIAVGSSGGVYHILGFKN
jgi:WD40 repeat protein